MSDTTNGTSTQQYPEYDHEAVHIKSEEQPDSKEWFQHEPKYDPVKVENETVVEAFVCGICSEHSSCKDGFCEHLRSHCCLDINKSEPNYSEEDIKTDNDTSDYQPTTDETPTVSNS